MLWGPVSFGRGRSVWKIIKNKTEENVEKWHSLQAQYQLPILHLSYQPFLLSINFNDMGPQYTPQPILLISCCPISHKRGSVFWYHVKVEELLLLLFFKSYHLLLYTIKSYAAFWATRQDPVCATCCIHRGNRHEGFNSEKVLLLQKLICENNNKRNKRGNKDTRTHACMPYMTEDIG